MCALVSASCGTRRERRDNNPDGRRRPRVKVTENDRQRESVTDGRCLQDSCATDCATPALTDISPRRRCSSRRGSSASSLHILLYLHAACNQIGCTVHGPSVRSYRPDVGGVGSGCDARVTRQRVRQIVRASRTQPARGAAAFTLHPVERRRVEPLRPTGS